MTPAMREKLEAELKQRNVRGLMCEKYALIGAAAMLKIVLEEIGEIDKPRMTDTECARGMRLKHAEILRKLGGEE